MINTIKWIQTIILLYLISCSVDVDNNNLDFYSSTVDYNSSSSSNFVEDLPSGDRLDVGSNIPTCQEMDFLFIVDNSGSMQDNQQKLVDSFPYFIDSIKNLTGFGQFHVGITTTDEYKYNISECQMLGGLTVQTGGTSSSNSLCGPWIRGNFMSTSEISDFSCAAQVGIHGSGSERPIGAFISSFEPYLASPGQCNEGFFREDAILVVIIITDEADNSTAGNTNLWLDKLKFYRGTLKNIVVIGFLPTELGSCPAYTDLQPMIDFINEFPYSYVGDVCDDDYHSLFLDTLDTIEKACENQG